MLSLGYSLGYRSQYATLLVYVWKSKKCVKSHILLDAKNVTHGSHNNEIITAPQREITMQHMLLFTDSEALATRTRLFL